MTLEKVCVIVSVNYWFTWLEISSLYSEETGLYKFYWHFGQYFDILMYIWVWGSNFEMETKFSFTNELGFFNSMQQNICFLLVNTNHKEIIWRRGLWFQVEEVFFSQQCCIYVLLPPLVIFYLFSIFALSLLLFCFASIGGHELSLTTGNAGGRLACGMQNKRKIVSHKYMLLQLSIIFCMCLPEIPFSSLWFVFFITRKPDILVICQSRKLFMCNIVFYNVVMTN